MQGKALEAEAESAVYVGIDTSKAWLDVYLHPIGHASRVENSKDGLRGLARDLQKLGIAMIVIEATGKLHRLAHRMLSRAGFPVAVVNPQRSRKLADVFGQLAKTDKIDARILALFGALIHPRVTPVPAKALAELQELVLARQSLKAEETALVNRLAAAENRLVKEILDGQLRQLRRGLRRLEARIEAVIAGDAGLQRRFDILTSIKGIGSIVAATLVAVWPSSDSSVAAVSPCSPAWRHSIATAGRCEANATSRAAEDMSAPACIWQQSARSDVIPI